MNTLRFICWSAIALNFAATTLFCARQTTNKQFLCMATTACVLLLLLISFVAGLCFCSRDKFRAFIPAAICLIGLPVSFFAARRLGGSIENWRFQRNLPRYAEVIHLIERGEIRINSSSSRIEHKLPNRYADLAWGIIAKTNSDGITVAFMTGSGFPVKHTGYLYVSSGNIEYDAETNRWPYSSRISTNWFRVQD
jgi:hypothetical protein